MKYIQLTVLSLFISLSSIAQNKATEKADKLFKTLKYVDAISAYTKLIEKGETSTHIYQKLAEANYKLFNTAEAEKWYKKAVQGNTDNSEMIYKYSQMLKANGKIEASNTQMDKFAALKPKDSRAKAYKKNNSYLAKLLEAKPDFRLEPLTINTQYSEFGGTVNNDKLYFTSARNTSRKTYKLNEEPFLDIYEVNVTDDSEAKTISGDVNTKFHEGLVTFSPDGNTMYFSRESFYDGDYERKDGDKTKFSVHYLYKASKNGETWDNIESLPFNNNSYSLKDPSLSKDGTTLYFSSDMPNGFGMYDIYKVSVGTNGTFGSPENLGSKVNTASNEGFPYISSKNTLYFSSTGHLGMGGLDVFKYEEGKITNLKQPVNSPSDDFSFTINENTEEGFVSSNRDGGKGSDDIYKITRLKPCLTEITVTVVDSDTGKILPNTMVNIKNNEGVSVLNKTTNAEGLVTYKSLCQTSLSITAKLDGYEGGAINYTAPKKNNDAVQIGLKPIQEIIVNDEVKLNPILFDFDKSNITAQGAFELDKLVAVMNKYSDIVIYVKSHTDHIGNNKYNMQLSERRAQSTVQYVISKGINKSRISGKGFGETEPKINCGKKCTDEERQLNRNSQFKIVSGGPNNK